MWSSSRLRSRVTSLFSFFFQAEDGIRDYKVTGVQTCALPISPAPGAATAHAQIGQWGVDLGSRDLSVKPGDDFYRYAEGHWLDTREIPPDRSRDRKSVV